MPEWTLDFRPEVSQRNLEHLRSRVAQLGEDDRLLLVFERQDAHQLEPVTRILDEAGLGWQPKGGHEDNYYLMAGRDLTRPGNPGVPDTPQVEH